MYHVNFLLLLVAGLSLGHAVVEALPPSKQLPLNKNKVSCEKLEKYSTEVSHTLSFLNFHQTVNNNLLFSGFLKTLNQSIGVHS
jgi:hypothetical protein